MLRHVDITGDRALFLEREEFAILFLCRLILCLAASLLSEDPVSTVIASRSRLFAACLDPGGLDVPAVHLEQKNWNNKTGHPINLRFKQPLFFDVKMYTFPMLDITKRPRKRHP